jgi:hypothetical protein
VPILGNSFDPILMFQIIMKWSITFVLFFAFLGAFSVEGSLKMKAMGKMVEQRGRMSKKLFLK